MNKLPINMAIQDQPQRFWPMYDELMTVVQYYPRNPIWAIRPYFPDTTLKLDIKRPEDLHPFLDSEEKLENVSRWLNLNMRSEYRSRKAAVLKLQGFDTKAYRHTPIPVTALSHASILYERIKYPATIGVLFPEALPIILRNVKRIWLPERFANEKDLGANWQIIEFATYVEYKRVA